METPETCLDGVKATCEPSKNASASVTLNVRGLNHIPALKNSMYAIVDKENREWKRRCVQLFVSQLLSSIPTSERATLTPLSLRCLIASLPHDDNWKVIREITLTCEKVTKGDEGATIVIEPL